MGPGVPDFYPIHVFEDQNNHETFMMKPKRKLGQMEDLENVVR